MNKLYFNILFTLFNLFNIPSPSHSRIISSRLIIPSISFANLTSEKINFNTDFTSKPTLFKSYGPLYIDMNNIKFKKNIFLIPTLNDQLKPLFLAVYCPELLINVKGSNEWKGWRASYYSFENNLLNKLCSTVIKY